MPAKQTALQHLAIGKESTWGTPAATLVYLPFDSASGELEIGNVVDNGKRNHISADYNVYYTTKKSTFEFETYAYLNELGHMFKAVFGAVTTTGASAPYTHTFAANSALNSLTVNHYNSADERQYAGMLVDEVNIKGDAEGIITVSVKMQGKAGATVVTTTPSISPTLSPLMGAFCSLTIGGVANANLFGFDISFKRNNKLIYGASNSQDPSKAVMGTFEVTGKFTFDVEGTTEYDMFAAQTERTIVLTLGNSASNQAVLTFTKAFVESASFDDGEENLRVDWDFRAVYNTTDAGPCKMVVKNATSSY